MRAGLRTALAGRSLNGSPSVRLMNDDSEVGRGRGAGGWGATGVQGAAWPGLGTAWVLPGLRGRMRPRVPCASAHVFLVCEKRVLLQTLLVVGDAKPWARAGVTPVEHGAGGDCVLVTLQAVLVEAGFVRQDRARPGAYLGLAVGGPGRGRAHWRGASGGMVRWVPAEQHREALSGLCARPPTQGPSSGRVL